MAGIQLVTAGGLVVAGSEEARSPFQVCTVPFGGNVFRYAGFTGTIGAALAANSEILQFRFVSGTKTLARVHKTMFDGLGIVAVATAAGPLGFYATVARAWTAAGSGGTRISVAGNNLKMETPSATSQVQDIGIATTGALTAGTKTFDANGFGQAIGGVGTAPVTAYGQSSIIAPQSIFNVDDAGMPLVLANQEGFAIRTTHAGPAGLTYAAGFSIQWSEVTNF